MRLLQNYLFLLLTFSSVAFSSCKKDNSEVSPAAALQQSNVAYGPDPAQKLDLYLPAGRSEAATKVAVLIHGGAWATGDKADVLMVSAINELRARMPQYAVISINYRLAGFSGNLFPTQELDTKAAIEFIYAKHSEYSYSDKIVLLGASAGAHLALLQAYKYTTPKIRAVVDFFGPTDLVQMYNDPAAQSPPSGISFLLNGTPSQQPAQYSSSSPINFVSAQVPPTQIFHGSADDVVKPQQSAALSAALQTTGVVKEYNLYPGEGHGFGTSANADAFNKVKLFLDANVQ